MLESYVYVYKYLMNIYIQSYTYTYIYIYIGKYGFPVPCPSCINLPNIEILKIPPHLFDLSQSGLSLIRPNISGPPPEIFRNNLNQPHWRKIYKGKGGH